MKLSINDHLTTILMLLAWFLVGIIGVVAIAVYMFALPFIILALLPFYGLKGLKRKKEDSPNKENGAS